MIAIILALLALSMEDVLKIVIGPAVAMMVVVLPGVLAIRGFMDSMRTEVASLGKRVDDLIRRLEAMEGALIVIRETLARHAERLQMKREWDKREQED